MNIYRGSTRFFHRFQGQRLHERTYTIDELSPEAREKALKKLRQEENWDSSDSDFMTDQTLDDLAHKGYNDMKASWSASYCQGDHYCFYGGYVEVRRIARRVLGKRWRKAERFFKKRTGHELAEQFGVKITSSNRHQHSVVDVEYGYIHHSLGYHFVPLGDSDRPLDEKMFTSYKVGSWHEAQESTLGFINGVLHGCEPIDDNAYYEPLREALEEAIKEEVDKLCGQMLHDIYEEIEYRCSDPYLIEMADQRLWYRDGTEADDEHQVRARAA